MKLEILSFNWKLFKSNYATFVSVSTKSWEITVLEWHEAIISSIIPSVLTIKYENKNWSVIEKEFAIWRWIIETWNNEIKILIDVFISDEELNIEKAEEAKKEALKIMEKYKNSKDQIDMTKFIEAEDMLYRSIAQLKMKRK